MEVVLAEEEPPLGASASDHVAAALRMGAGAVPFAGAAFNELITLVIPGVRQSRVEAYLRFLKNKVDELSEEQLKSKLSSELAIDVVEEGAFQAVRALSDERRDQITHAVAFGLRGDQQELLEAKRMLQLLRELDEAQVILLASKLMKNYRDSSFLERHANVLEPVMAHLQSTREELDRSIVQSIGGQKLLSLGLVRHQFAKLKKGEIPDFDEKTGMVKSRGTEITPLGRLLLRRLGLAEEDDN